MKILAPLISTSEDCSFVSSMLVQGAFGPFCCFDKFQPPLLDSVVQSPIPLDLLLHLFLCYLIS